MLEKELLVVGRKLRLPAGVFGPGQSIDNLNHPGFRDQNLHRIGEGAAHRHAFQWLHYQKGVVNQVSPLGMDVLSGDFGGCWMIYYLMNGIPRVGHVGTYLGRDDPDTKAAKRAWRNFATATYLPYDSRGFQPHLILFQRRHLFWDNRSLVRGVHRVLGLVTTEKKCYAALLLRDEQDGNLYTVAAVEPAQTVKRGQQLQNLFTATECA